MTVSFPDDHDGLQSAERAGGNTERGPAAQHEHDPRDSGPTPSGQGGHGDPTVTGHHVAGLRLHVPGEQPQPLPPQLLSCDFLVDQVPSGVLRELEANPPLSACGRHLVDLD